MSEEITIKRAEFDKKVCVYWLYFTAIIMAVTVVGFPLLLIWFPFGMLYTKRYLDRMDCTLTNKALKVKKGILVRVEKTIPLEKITDMGMVQGPIMRIFNLHQLTVETAGQSATGALVALTGIVDAKAFRDAVLSQREKVSGSTSTSTSETSPQASIASNPVLEEIRDSLLRIEANLKDTSDRQH